METAAGIIVLFLLFAIPLAFFAGIVVLIVMVIKRQRRLQAERQGQMATVARQMGATFQHSPPQSYADMLSQFKFYRSGLFGRQGSISDLFELQRGGISWMIFDYTYREKQGGTVSDSASDNMSNYFTRYSTVAAAELPPGKLPDFVLFRGRPGLLEKLLGEAIGIEDDVFEQTYTLESDDAQRAVGLFTPEVIASFTEDPMIKAMKDMIVESDGRRFVLYKSGDAVVPADRGAFVVQAEAIVDMLTAGGRT